MVKAGRTGREVLGLRLKSGIRNLAFGPGLPQPCKLSSQQGALGKGCSVVNCLCIPVGRCIVKSIAACLLMTYFLHIHIVSYSLQSVSHQYVCKSSLQDSMFSSQSTFVPHCSAWCCFVPPTFNCLLCLVMLATPLLCCLFDAEHDIPATCSLQLHCPFSTYILRCVRLLLSVMMSKTVITFP